MVNADLMIAIVGDDATLARTRALYDRLSDSALVIARLDVPAKLAVIPSRPPCLQCANSGELLAPTGSRVENAGFIAMLAALETIKLLTHDASARQPTLVEFNGYRVSGRTLGSSAGLACGCGPARTTKSIE
jgi:hypothetical protein